jgi:hypothetical protein
MPVVEDSNGEQPLLDELYLQVKKWKINKDTLQSWMEVNGSDQVKRAILYTKEKAQKGEIKKNIGGYLATMIKQSGFFDPEEEKREKNRQAEGRKKELSVFKAQLELLEYQYSNAVNEKIREVVAKVSGVNTNTLEYLQKNDNPIINPRLKQLGITTDDLTVTLCRDDKILRGAFKGAILHLYEEHFAEIIKQYKSAIEDVRRKME